MLINTFYQLKSDINDFYFSFFFENFLVMMSPPRYEDSPEESNDV
jgi:hypothetical protein